MLKSLLSLLFLSQALSPASLWFKRPSVKETPIPAITRGHLDTFRVLLKSAGGSQRVLVLGEDQRETVSAISREKYQTYWIRYVNYLSNCPLFEVSMSAIILPEEVEETARLARAIAYTLEYDGLLFVPEWGTEMDGYLREHGLVRTGMKMRRFFTAEDFFVIYKRFHMNRNGNGNGKHAPMERAVFDGSLVGRRKIAASA